MKKILGLSLFAIVVWASFLLTAGGVHAGDAKALEAPKSSAASGHNAEGIKHYNKGHWDVAEEHFREAVSADGNSAEAHYNLALALDKLGNHGEATQHFKKALDLDPNNPAIADSKILKAHLGM